MKKFINTKKVIVAGCILTIALFVFPLSSFAKDDKGGKGGGPHKRLNKITAK
jgi:hypothetical protein